MLVTKRRSRETRNRLQPRRAEEEAEKQRLAEEEKKKAEAEAEKQRIALAEKKKAEEEAAKKRQAEEKKKAEQQAKNNQTNNQNSSQSNIPQSFKNCEEMRKYYPNGVASTHPAYASKHDRDKDGWACEVSK